MRPFTVAKDSLTLRLASSSARRIWSHHELTIRIKPARDIRAKSRVRSRTLPNSERSYSRQNIPHKMNIFRARVPRPLVLDLLIEPDMTTIGALMLTLWILRLRFFACNLYARPRTSCVVVGAKRWLESSTWPHLIVERRAISLSSAPNTLTGREWVRLGKKSRQMCRRRLPSKRIPAIFCKSHVKILLATRKLAYSTSLFVTLADSLFSSASCHGLNPALIDDRSCFSSAW